MAVPLLLSQVAQRGILFIGAMLLGWLGPVALAGGGLALTTYNFCFSLAYGTVSASGNLVALAHGAGRRRDVVASVRAGLLMSLILSVLFGAILWNIKPLMLALGQSDATATIAQGYLHLLVFAMPFSILFFAMRNFATGIGQPGPTAFITLSALLVSAGLGWLLSQWIGVYGIGLASVFTYLYMSGVFAIVVTRHPAFRRYPIFAGFERRDFAMLWPVLKIGVPTAATLALETGLFTACAWLMGAFGAAPLAAHQSMMQLIGASFIVPLGLTQATSMRVGQAAGAGDWERVRRTAQAGQWLALGWTLSTASLLLLAPGPLIGLFLSGEHAHEARAVALSLAPLAALLCLLDGWQAVLNGGLRALKDARFTMVAYVLGCLGVGLPLAWLLSRHGTGAVGVWWGICVGLLAVALMLHWRFERSTRRLILLRPQL